MDHRQALIVHLSELGDDTRLITSHVETQPRRSGQSPLHAPYESQQVPADDSHQRELTGHLNIYYDAVIASIRDADAILLLGPGEAKRELAKRLARRHLASRIVGIETTDKMTRRQVAAVVRDRFSA
jgi:hypothetical protein